MKIFKKTMLFIAAAGLLFSLASFVFVKIFLPQDKIKQYIVSYAKENFNREVSFDKVSFNIIGINLTNFALSERSSFAKGTFIKAKKLTLKISLKPLLHKKIEVQTLGIDGMYIQMHKDKNGRFNFNDITTKKEQTPENVQNKAKSVKNDIPLKIYKFDVKNSVILFKDDILNLDTEISDFNMKISDFSFTELFPCEISFNVKYKQKNIDAFLPVNLQSEINLNDLDFDKLLVKIISFKTNYNGAELNAAGTFENITTPKIDLKLTFKNINTETFKDFFTAKTKFKIPSADCEIKTIIDTANKNADILQFDFLLPQSTCYVYGNINWSGEKPQYNLKTNIDIALDKISEFFPDYNLSGKIKSKLKISNADFNGNVDGTNISFKYPPYANLSGTNFKAVIHSKDNISVENSSGVFNGGNFKFSGSYTGNNLAVKLKMDKLIIKETSPNADGKIKEKQKKEQKSSDFKLNLNADISIDLLEIPYLYGRNGYIKTSLKSITSDMKNSNGYFSAGISNGTITNVEKLAENKFAKIFLMIFNALNNNIKQSQKIDESSKKGINYESLLFDVAFANGKMTAKNINFKLPITTVATTGFIDFNPNIIDLKVNTGLYAKMKIGGTVDNPKTSFDVIGTVGEILNDASKGTSADLGKKLDGVLKNLLGR